MAMTSAERQARYRERVNLFYRLRRPRRRYQRSPAGRALPSFSAGLRGAVRAVKAGGAGAADGGTCGGGTSTAIGSTGAGCTLRGLPRFRGSGTSSVATSGPGAIRFGRMRRFSARDATPIIGGAWNARGSGRFGVAMRLGMIVGPLRSLDFTSTVNDRWVPP